MKRYVKKLIEEYGLCTWCIGRQLTKDPCKFYEIGERIFGELGLKTKNVCWLCDGFFHKNILVKKIWKKLSEFEFESIDFGIITDMKKVEFEDELRARFKITGGLVLKKAALAYIRQKFSTLYGVEIEVGEPDLRVLLHIGRTDFMIITKPVILELMFLKYKKENKIRADECKICKGEGCNSCEWTGKVRDGSLESFLLFNLSKLLGGEIRIKWSVRDFEGSTIDGLGRPIYLILKNSKKMKSAPLLIPYKPLNGFQIVLSRKVTKDEIKDVFVQTTLVKVRVSRILLENEMKYVSSFFKNKSIFITDRNGKVRKKNIYFLRVKPLENKIYQILIKHDTGLNLEKFLSGDGTGSQIEPTLTDLLKDIKVKIEDVDVLNVEEKGN